MSVAPAHDTGHMSTRRAESAGAPSSRLRNRASAPLRAAVIAASLAAAAALLFSACSGKSNSSNDISSVARRSVQALIDHDVQAYLNELNPDYRSDPSHAPDPKQDLTGCLIKDVRIAATGSQNVTVIFSSPCGTNGGDSSGTGRPFVGCSVSLIELNGRAYTQDYACTT